jgi:hypothetical protein
VYLPPRTKVRREAEELAGRSFTGLAQLAGVRSGSGARVLPRGSTFDRPGRSPKPRIAQGPDRDLLAPAGRISNSGYQVLARRVRPGVGEDLDLALRNPIRGLMHPLQAEPAELWNVFEAGLKVPRGFKPALQVRSKRRAAFRRRLALAKLGSVQTGSPDPI